MTCTWLFNLMCKLTKKYPHTPPQVFVDDTSMSSKSSRWSTVLNMLTPCILDFAKGAKELELSLSSKAMLVASHPKLAKMLQHEFANHGIELQIPKPKGGARDLGISNTAGIHRPNRLASNRFNSSRNRISKIQQLVKLHRKSKVLFSSSALPASTWGASSCRNS